MEKISIIIPCRNEEQYIEQCICSFIEMDYPNELLEIIIIDGLSTDKTEEIVLSLQKKHHFIKIIKNLKKLTPNALNLGIKNSSNELIMIASAHSSFSPNYITEVLKEINATGCDGAGGVVITLVKNQSKKSISICKVLSNKFGVGNSMFRIGSEKTIKVDTVPFGIYSKDIFYSIGLYNEKLLRNQDMEFSKRLSLAKKEIYLVPAAKCYYYARETFIQLAKNNFGNGMWVPLTVYITKKTSSLSLRHFIPLIFILSIVLPILLIIVLPKLFFVSVLSFFAYLILILVMSYKLYDKSTSYLQLIAAFFVLHFSYGFGSLVGLFRINYLWK